MHKADAVTKLQFRVLFKVFLLRVIDLELLSEESDSAKLLGQFAALLAAVSFAFTAPLIFVGGLAHETIMTMEHVLIATTMVVVGLFSVLSWDSTFPDRRDVLVLAPLPIHSRTLFLSKLAAVGFALSLCILALNAFVGCVWPFIFSPSASGAVGLLRSLAAYWTTMFASGAFVFCSILGLQWVVAQFLSRQQFLRVSAFLQTFLFCLFVTVYFLEPSVETVIKLPIPEIQRLLAWSPTYWFLGLFQELNGSLEAAFAPLAIRAWIGLVIAIALAGVAYALSYLRTLQATIEEPDIQPHSQSAAWSPQLGSSLQTAVLLFSLRTLLRSRSHRIILSFYLGVGFAIVLACAQPSISYQRQAHGAVISSADYSLLLASLLMIAIPLVGIRVVSSMPISLRANWVFRMTEAYSLRTYQTATWLTLCCLGLFPTMIVSAVVFSYAWPWKLAIMHLAVLSLLGVTLVNFGLYRFQKLPFTCSFLPGKSNIQYAFWVYVLGILPLTFWGTHLELIALQRPIRYAGMIAFLVIAVLISRLLMLRSIDFQSSLKFEERLEPQLFGLGLPHRDG